MGMEKGMIAWKGKTLVENAIEILSSLCEEIIISANNDQYNFLKYPVIADKYENCGPMGGVLTCLQESVSARNLTLPVDVPLISPEIYFHLLEQDGDYDVIVPIDHEFWYQPLCAVFNKSIITVMEEQIQNGILGFTPLIQKVNSLEVPFQQGMKGYHNQTFLNINSPADLKALY